MEPVDQEDAVFYNYKSGKESVMVYRFLTGPVHLTHLQSYLSLVFAS